MTMVYAVKEEMSEVEDQHRTHGVFTTREKAEAVIRMMTDARGDGDGYYIVEYPLDPPGLYLATQSAHWTLPRGAEPYWERHPLRTWYVTDERGPDVQVVWHRDWVEVVATHPDKAVARRQVEEQMAVIVSYPNSIPLYEMPRVVNEHEEALEDDEWRAKADEYGFAKYLK